MRIDRVFGYGSGICLVEELLGSSKHLWSEDIRQAHLKLDTWKVQSPRGKFCIAGNLRRSHNSLFEALLEDFPGRVVIVLRDPIAGSMYGRQPEVSSSGHNIDL